MKKQLTKLDDCGTRFSSTLCVTPALAHHSFAMYDQTKTTVLTGVAYQFVAQANHAEIHFYVVGPDGKLVKDKDGKNVGLGRRDGRRGGRGGSKALRRPRSPLVRSSASS